MQKKWMIYSKRQYGWKPKRKLPSLNKRSAKRLKDVPRVNFPNKLGIHLLMRLSGWSCPLSSGQESPLMTFSQTLIVRQLILTPAPQNFIVLDKTKNIWHAVLLLNEKIKPFDINAILFWFRSDEWKSTDA